MTRTAVKTAQKLKIRRGDMVEVLTGKDVGRRGKVLEVIPTEGRLIVEKINIVKRQTKPRPVKGSRGAQMTPGGVIEMEAPVRVDNVALVCPDAASPPASAIASRTTATRSATAGAPAAAKTSRSELNAMAETTITPPRLRGRYESDVRGALQERSRTARRCSCRGSARSR